MVWLDEYGEHDDPMLPADYDWASPPDAERAEFEQWSSQFGPTPDDEDAMDRQYDEYQARHCADPDQEC